jgi:GNAT superfamily N-acetyltransferase
MDGCFDKKSFEGKIIFMTITIRQMLPADLEAAGLIAMSAYGQKQSSEAVLRRYLTIQPDGWYLALLNDEPVGLGGAIDFGSFASLGMMSVLPAAQKRGIGQALMERLLSWLDERGCPTVLLNARPQAVTLYERCGFTTLQETRQFAFTRLVSESEELPGISLLEHAELPALAVFDQPAFGASRLSILSAYFERDPRRFFIARGAHGELEGFLVAGESNVGPWHAASAEVADRLLRQALRLTYTTGRFLVSVLESNHQAQELFARHNGQLFATLAHMSRGQLLPRDSQQRLYSMASLMLC